MRRFLLLGLTALALLPPPTQAQRAVALTFDDLPLAGGGELAEAAYATGALLAALSAHGAPADGFVTGAYVEVAGEAEARRDLLRRWRGAGHGLHNHGYSHLPCSATDSAAYLADTERGHDLVASLLREVDPHSRVGFFRAPYNDLGESAASRASLAASLAGRGVRLAPFTVEHADYLFDAVYRDALARGDTAAARRVGGAYVGQLDSAFAFAERLSAETFGREVPQVLLLHANRINADYLGAMLERLAGRGYAFVTLAEAVRDPAYSTADVYTRKWGISWLHRWRVGLGLPDALRAEPEPPAWVLEAHDALGR